MLSFQQHRGSEPTLVLMHCVAGSRREWEGSIGHLNGRLRCVAIDMPGHGESREVGGYSIREMADAVAEVVAALDLNRFILVGHSMSGKVAAVLARLAEDHDPRLGGMAGLVLVAASPPGPEPMPEETRTFLRGLFEPEAGPGLDAAAGQFVRNLAGELPAGAFASAVEDVARMNKVAWTAWLERGTREDHAAFVGALSVPTLCVVGEHDAAMGLEVQKKFTLPHCFNARLERVSTKHLVPWEAPVRLAELIETFAKSLA